MIANNKANIWTYFTYTLFGLYVQKKLSARNCWNYKKTQVPIPIFWDIIKPEDEIIRNNSNLRK